ncbi:hypothetical protein Bca52824_057614 [Brassica carinata]|uniref:Uncharacterized protein n=1 Tax=Brassica carinata TaxID=52824 RepID=A0A8X7QQS1_BRACI|nr:hypothetical protein Bca52824_057614 [Brassica carinata]
MELGVDENLISSLLLPGSNHGRRHLSSSRSEPSILVRTSQPLTCPLAEKSTIAPATLEFVVNSLSPCRDKAGGNDEDDVTEINRHDVVVSPAVRAQIAAGRFSPPTGKTRCSFASSSEDSELHLAVEVVEGSEFESSCGWKESFRTHATKDKFSETRNNKRVDRKLVPNKSKFNLNSCLKCMFTNYCRPKSRVEIVCVEQVVGVYARRYDGVRKHRPVCFDKLVAESHLRSTRTYGGCNSLLALFFSLALCRVEIGSCLMSLFFLPRSLCRLRRACSCQSAACHEYGMSSNG